MLKLKSFKISERDEASKFLETNMLHGKSSILVSEGQVMIPYEDGTPPSVIHLILSAKEDRNNFEDQLIPIVHSQRVLEVDIAGVTKQIEDNKAKFVPLLTVDAKLSKADKKEVETKNSVIRSGNDKIQKEITRLENVKAQKENQIVFNNAEITNKRSNIAVFTETIANLEASLKNDGTNTGK